MKAIRVHAFGGPEVLKLEDVPDARACSRTGPGAGQGRRRQSGRNVYSLGHLWAQMRFPTRPAPMPAGIVEQVGPGVDEFQGRRRAFISPARSPEPMPRKPCAIRAPFIRCPKNNSFEARRCGWGALCNGAPRTLSPRQGRWREKRSWFMAHQAAVGIAAVQLARAAGFTVIGTAGTEKGLALVKGKRCASRPQSQRCGSLQQVMELTGGRGVEIILEIAAHTNLGKDLGVLAKFGRVIVVGSRGPVEINSARQHGA